MGSTLQLTTHSNNSATTIKLPSKIWQQDIMMQLKRLQDVQSSKLMQKIDLLEMFDFFKKINRPVRKINSVLHILLDF